MVQVTSGMLVAIAKAANPLYKPKASIVKGIADYWYIAEAGSIDTINEAAAFLGNACIETGGFRTLKEDGGPSYYKKYEGRKDLGNTEPGYGIKYPGRGIFQNTGYANMVILTDKLGADFVEYPELLEEPEWSMKAAVDYWNQKKLGSYALAGNFKAVGRGINRGKPTAAKPANHEAERLAACAKAVTLLGSLKPISAPTPKTITPKPAGLVMANPPTDWKGDQIVFYVQTLLDKKGWHEVGTVDGLGGARTEGAILAYRNEFKPPLPNVKTIDQQLITALETGPDRMISATRAETTVADLRKEGDETILTTDNLKTAAATGGAFAGLGGVDQKGMIDQAKEAIGNAGALRETADQALDIVQWLAQHWWMPVLVLCAFLFWRSQKIAAKRLDDHRSGKNVEL